MAVRVQPKSRRPGLGGTWQGADGPRLKIAVAEAAESGRANRAACKALARALAVPVSAVVVQAGAANREKMLAVAGDPKRLASRLQAL